ncbi:putative gustatory receptor 28a [Phymastichus coffea]|uniref:putative gustatory receptor 28a n=1 Tax=Phymastichus coffea TaxID=108790 RepID=UPI00273ACDAD|nr:putative gustatory receptor 28a [Phymastichus coffea]
MISQKKTLEESIYPLNLLNAFLGLSIFEIPCNRPWPKLSILYILIRSSAYGALLWYIGTYVPVKHSKIKIIPVVYQVILAVNIFIAAISTVLGIINYRHSSILVRRLKLADETLEVFGIDPDYVSEYRDIVKKTVLWSVGVALILACEVAMNCIVFEDLSKGILVTIIFDIPLLQNPMIELNFGTTISILGKRFERLNALIQNVTDSTTISTISNDVNNYKNILKCNQRKVRVQPTFHQQNRNNLELLLKVTRQLHLDLCGISRKVNDVCSKQMSMQMASTFLLLTGFSYSLYLVYNEPYILLEQKAQQYVSLAIWIAISIFRMIHVVRISVNVTTEAQKTSQIAHEIQVPRSKHKLIDEIHQLSLQIMQHPLYFTASGLIVLDFGYVRGFVGSVTTYLMILIQNQPDMLKAAYTLAALDNNTVNSLSSGSAK